MKNVNDILDNTGTGAKGKKEPAAPYILEEGEIGGSMTMSRALALSAHGLTINEARVMMLACRLIDPKKSPYAYAKDGYVKVRVTAGEFAQLSNMGQTEQKETPSTAYEGLKKACEGLFKRHASWKEGKKKINLAWAWKSVYHESEGWAEICFSPDMTQHLFMLKEKFVRYRIEYARGLRSIYSANLLRLLMTQKSTGKLMIKLDEFRAAMEVPESYLFGEVKRRVIDVALKELAEKANLNIQFEEIKRGRSVYSLKFKFVFDKKMQQELPLDDANIDPENDIGALTDAPTSGAEQPLLGCESDVCSEPAPVPRPARVARKRAAAAARCSAAEEVKGGTGEQRVVLL